MSSTTALRQALSGLGRGQNASQLCDVQPRHRKAFASFFAEPPPRILSPRWRAVLAGTAEYLCKQFNLPIPGWTEEPEYSLPEIWNPWTDMGLDMKELEEERKAKSHECFLRRTYCLEAAT